MENESQQHKHHHNHQPHNQQTENVDPGKECDEIPSRIYVNKCIVDAVCYDNSNETYDDQNPNERIFVNKSLVDNFCCEHNSEPPEDGPVNKIYVNSSFFNNLCSEESQAEQTEQVFYDKVYVNTSFFKNLCCDNHSPDSNEQPASDPSDNIMIICVPDQDQAAQNTPKPPAPEPKKKEDKKHKKNDKFTLHQNIQIHLDKFLTKVIESQAAKNNKSSDGAGCSNAPNQHDCKVTAPKLSSCVSMSSKKQPTETCGGAAPTTPPPQKSDGAAPAVNKTCDHVNDKPPPSKNSLVAVADKPTCNHEQKQTSPPKQGQISGGDGSDCNHAKEQAGPSNQVKKILGGDGPICEESKTPPKEDKPSGGDCDLNKDKSVMEHSFTFKQELTNCLCHDVHKKGHQHSHHHRQHSENRHQAHCEQTSPKHSARASQRRYGKRHVTGSILQCEPQTYTNPFKFPHSVESQMKFYYDLITDPRYQICTNKRTCDGGIESTPSICRCDAPPAPPISEPSCSCDEVAEFENSRKSRKCSAVKNICNIV